MRITMTVTLQCHESGCHSLQLHISHGLHLPSCTAHTHSRPPLHQSHSCHIHSLVLIVSPHLYLIHSHTFKQHSHMHPLRSLVSPWLTFLSGFPSLSFRVLPGLLSSFQIPDSYSLCFRLFYINILGLGKRG